MPERRRNPDPSAANPSDFVIRIAQHLRFLPVTGYFFGKDFSRVDLAGAREWNMQRNDVILGVLNFFGYQGVRSAWLVALSGHRNMVETHVKKRAIARFSINSRAFHRQPPGHGQVPNDPSDPPKNSVD